MQGVSAAVAGTGISVSGATGAVTITNIGVQSFNGLTGAVTGVTVGGANTFTALNTFNAGISSAGGTFSALTRFTEGISASGATLSSNTTIPSGSTLTVNGNFVANGNVNLGDAVTDAITVTGVLAANGGLSAAGGTFSGNISAPNIVTSFNGLTGAVTGVTVGGANTFTALNTFNAGISAAGGTFSSLTRFTAGISSAGGTFSSLTRFTAGITASTLYVSGGATFGTDTSVNGTVYTKAIQQYAGAGSTTPLYINSDSSGNGGGNTITTIGDSVGEINNTHITVDDNTGVIVLSAGAGGINNSGGFLNQVTAPSFADTYSFVETYRTTTTATTANQTIATIPSVYDGTASIMNYPAFEVTISARDTVLNKTEMLKMLVVQDGTNTVNTQYGLIRTGATGPVSSYSTTLSGALDKNLLIRATPLSANSTAFTTTVRAQSNG